MAPLAVMLFATSGCGSPSSPPARRSIVLVTIDTLRADHVTAAIAPGLSRLAAGSVVFENAVSVGPVTLPGHASLLTGQFPPAHGVRDNHLFSLDPRTQTYPALLKSRGYDTAAFVSAVVLHRRYGLAAGFDVYDDAIAGDDPERSAAETLASAERWLSRRSSGPPFFLWIHLFEPHAPYRTGSYAGEIAEVDRELERFFTVLRSRGLWDSTVLSVTSDHGESLGEHGEDTHGLFIYDSTVRIPWILKAPALPPGRFAPQVRLVDVMPTMLGLAESAPQDAPGAPPVEGRDLVSWLGDGTDPGLSAYMETLLPKHQFNWSALSGIRTADLKYIRAPEPELYQLREDPGETRNVALAEPTLASKMQRVVVAAAAAGSFAALRTRPADAAATEKLMALGYIGKAYPSDDAPDTERPDPKHRVELYRLVMSALTLSESGHADAALAALGRAEQMESGLAQVHYLKGVILGGQHRYREAAAALEQTVVLSPRDVLARFKLALAYLRLGDHPRAERVLLKVIADDPDNMRAYQNLGALAYARGDLARAETMARRAVDIDTSYYEAWNTLGAVYLQMRRPDDAVAALTRAVALGPKSGQAHYNLSLAFRAQGDTRAAAAAGDRACQLDPRFCQ